MSSRFQHGLYSFGVPIFGSGGLIPVPGNVYWVHPAATNASDGNDGLSPQVPLKTLSGAHALMTANQNDTAIVIGNSSAAAANTVRETATLTWSKSLCHIVGAMSLNKISHRASIRATGNFSPLVNVTADGCVFANFHAFHGYSTAETQICWQESGQRNAHFNLHLAGMGHATAGDQAGSRSLLLTGDGERYFKECTIGLDTIARSTTNAELELKTIAVRDIFEDCLFLAFADNAGHLFIKADAASNSVDRFALFNRCIFLNAIHSTGTAMTAAVAAHASLSATLLFKDCTIVGADDWEASASGQVMVDGAAPTAGTTGLAVDPTV